MTLSMEYKMKFKFLKAGLVSLLVFVSTVSNAGLISFSYANLEGTLLVDWTLDDVLFSYEDEQYQTVSIVSEGLEGSYEAVTQYYEADDEGGVSVFVVKPCRASGECNNESYNHLFQLDALGDQLYEVISGGMGRFTPGSYMIDDGESPKQIIGELTIVKVVKSKLVEVPEPSTLAILALSIIGLASRRFKKS